MDISFKNKKLQQELLDPKYLLKHFDKKEARSIASIITKLEEVQYLYQLPKTFQFHLLKGSMKGKFSIYIPALGKKKGNNRLLFIPIGDNSQETDPKKISHIQITGIEDYHK